MNDGTGSISVQEIVFIINFWSTAKPTMCLQTSAIYVVLKELPTVRLHPIHMLIWLLINVLHWLKVHQ
jgi:hypothetical protein